MKHCFLVALVALGVSSCRLETVTPSSVTPSSVTPKLVVAADNQPLLLLTPAELTSVLQRKSTFNTLVQHTTNQLNYTPQPVAVYAPPSHYNSTGVNTYADPFEADALAAYRAAFCYLLTGDARFATTSQHILDAWATTLHQVSSLQGEDNINFNASYMIMAASWVRGVNGWNNAPFDQFLRTVVLPTSQAARSDNHGLWAVLMESSAGAYLSDTTALGTARRRWQVIMQGEVAPDGSMPNEMDRSDTNDYHGGPDKGIKGIAYTHYSLLPASMAAKIFADQGRPMWQAPGGQLLQLAFNKAAAWTLDPTSFPYYLSNNGNLIGVRNASYFALLLRYYPNQNAQMVLQQGNITQDGFLLLEMFGQ